MGRGPASPSIYASGIVDLTKQSVKLERVSRLNNVEFLQTDPRHRLTQHRFVTMVGEVEGPADMASVSKWSAIVSRTRSISTMPMSMKCLRNTSWCPNQGEETTFGLLTACIGVSNEPICPSMTDRRLAAVLFAAHFWTMRCL